MWQMLAGPFLDSVQSAYDPATSRTMIKGVTCKYLILPVSSSKLYMFFPVRATNYCSAVLLQRRHKTREQPSPSRVVGCMHTSARCIHLSHY